MKAERNRRYNNNEFFCLWQARSQAMGLTPNPAGQGGERRSWPEPRPGPQETAASVAAAAIHKRSRSAYPEQSHRDDPASATPTAEASGYKTASTAVVTGIEPAAPAVSTEKDDDYVYIRVPREKVASVDTGRTKPLQHLVSQSAGPQNAAPVFQSVPVQLPTPPSQQCLGDSDTISYARVSVSQPGQSGDTSVDAVETKPHLEALTHHVAGRLAVPGASAAAEVKSSWSLVRGLLQCRRSWWRSYGDSRGCKPR